ncbi:hypothetical protein BDK51DRAFT_36508 [Blyttiomyces helicus]|uniref:Integrator complex subunit 6-like beta-barrel domain-containing protein n=1 Tax=Blyttiomyces helicus TaxID=388810 RepID=A0A4P9WD84_9FUNG|nr:hypothetical protein BDK51DRAFT_36508 [Blyttiomyces helicus]|eukprot:RKO90649.1 hypothetical protein BDK51DRAFT_36508 [Blyttiomyces helicus]
MTVEGAFYQADGTDADTDKDLLRELKALKAHDMSNAGAAMSSLFQYLNTYRATLNLDRAGDPRENDALRPRVRAHVFKSKALPFVLLGAIAGESRHDVYFLVHGRIAVQRADYDRLDRETAGDFLGGIRRRSTDWSPAAERRSHYAPSPGSQWYVEPFRWDQQLYTFLLASPETPISSWVGAMNEVMYARLTVSFVRGTVFRVSSAQAVSKCIDNCMVNKCHPGVLPRAAVCHIEGVVVDVEEHPSDIRQPQGRRLPNEKVLIFAASSSTRNMPIPESFWPENVRAEPGGDVTLPPRKARPTFLYTTTNDVHVLPENCFYDRFTMDQSSKLVAELKERPPGTCFTVSAPGLILEERKIEDPLLGEPDPAA